MSTPLPGAAADPDFPAANLPYGVFRPDSGPPRVGVALGASVLDLAALGAAGLLPHPEVFARPSLNAFMALGRPVWTVVRDRVGELLADPRQGDTVAAALHRRSEARLLLPFEVADYTDFYSSLDHATNAGRLFRPEADPIRPNWRHLPVGYHGRAGTVVASGTPVRRPTGQRREQGEAAPTYGPSQRLDIEAEVGFVVGLPSEPGRPLSTSDFREHVFGVVLVNDWSARDIQAWESVPLGPFLAKSFATSVSPWVVPLDALEAARVSPPPQEPRPLPYLHVDEPWGLDLTLEVRLNGHVVSRPPFATMYWTAPQQLAHLTANGAPVRTGDLYASGTVSGPEPDQRGSLLELAWGGAEPLQLSDGTARSWLADGDTVSIRATAPAVGGGRLGFGEVVGRVQPALDLSRGSRRPR